MFLGTSSLLVVCHPAPSSSRTAWAGEDALQRRVALDLAHNVALLAAEELVIGALDPARAKILVGEIVHVLEDRKRGHQPRRQRRVSGLVRIDRAEPPLEKAPVDRPAELRQRVIEVDDLVEPGLERIVLPAVPSLFGPHRITSAKPTERQNHDQMIRSIRKKSNRPPSLSCKCNDSLIRANPSKTRRLRILHRRLMHEHVPNISRPSSSARGSTRTVC
jgi:hypothetical protein